MPAETVKAASAPAPAAVVPVPSSTEADLDQLFAEEPPAETPPAETPQGTTPAATPEEVNLAALDEPPPPAETKTTLDPDQSYILGLIPNRQVAEVSRRALSEQWQLAQALEKGDLDSVMTVVRSVHPKAAEHLDEMLYQKFAEGFVDRFIAENDPDSGPQAAPVRALTDRIGKLENVLRSTLDGQNRAAQEREHTDRLDRINAEVDQLLDLVNFSKEPEDRAQTKDLIYVALSRKPETLKTVYGGDMRALRPILKEQVQRYVTRDRRLRGSSPQPSTVPQATPAVAALAAGGTNETTSSALDRASAWLEQQQKAGQKT